MRTTSFICLYIFAFILGIHSQSVDNEIITEPSSTYWHYKELKAPFDVRGMSGMTIIEPIFDDPFSVWEEDAKAAIQYACHIMEEYLPTAYPIKIRMIRNPADTHITFTRTSTTLSTEDNNKHITENCAYPYIRLRSTLKRNAIEGKATPSISSSPFEEVDATIYFSPEDIFSTSLDGTVEPDKYDLVTVTLRELAKALGMWSTVKPMKGIDNQLDVSHKYENEYYVTPYVATLLNSNNVTTPTEAYNCFTSGNVILKGDYMLQSPKVRKLHAPNVFDKNSSLMYFEEDKNNKETLLFQPELPKGTAIHKIGEAFRDILIYSDWYTLELPTSTDNDTKGATIIDKNIYSSENMTIFSHNGISNNTSRKSTTISKNDTININFNTQSARNAKRAKMITVNENLYSMFPNSQYDGVLLKSPYSYYPVNTDGEKGITVYLLKKDGSLQKIAHHDDAWLPLSVNIADFITDEHARTADGYVRVRFNLNFHETSPTYVSGDNKTWINTVQFLAMDAAPLKPKLALKKNFLKSAPNDPDSYYKEVNLVFRDLYDVTEARMIQKEYDEYGLISSTSYPVQIQSGNFIAEVDKELRTTFQLVVSNEKGEETSEIVTVYPELRGIYRELDIVPTLTDNLLQWKYIDKNGLKVNMESKHVELYNLSDPRIRLVKDIVENELFIDKLTQGVYSLRVKDAENNTYVKKIIK